MNKPTTYTMAYRECCTDSECASGLRNNYFLGKRLTPDMFRVEQQYLVERRRLLNRAIHGWGVVYGYGIETLKDRSSNLLKIKSGLALDECGRELLQVGELQLELDQVIVVDKDGRHLEGEERENEFSEAEQESCMRGTPFKPACWKLSVHYAEQDREPVLVNDPCHCERQDWDHICETVRYTLCKIDCAKCCNDFPCELTCKCGTGRCCDEPANINDPKGLKEDSGHEGKPFKRGGCRCLCDHLTSLEPGADCGGYLCEIEEPCGLVRVDLRRGVPLACVKVVRDDCHRWIFGEEIEACGPRRLVKRNDLLFDLIRGCDLTRISEIGWKDWHRREEPISFDEFSEALGPDGERQDVYVSNDFWVEFSRPVRKDTLRPDCFAMTIMSFEREGGWWQTFRVPIVGVDTTNFPPVGDDPEDHVRGATIVVDGAWVEDGVRGRRSLFLGSEARVELEVRGDFIIDCNGQTVDANAVGLSPIPTGNGTPGGTFLSTVRVAPAREAPARKVPYDSGDRQQGASS